MPFLALDEWRVAGVHWHAFTERRRGNAPAHTGDRMTRRGTPHTTLRDPWAVASWIDEQTRQHVHHREVFAIRDGLWVTMSASQYRERTTTSVPNAEADARHRARTMSKIPARITGLLRAWLESPPPEPKPTPPRVVNKCTECATWCIGADQTEAAERLAAHRRHRHG